MTEPRSPLLTPDEFSEEMRWEFVRAYPVISGVPDARLADRDEIEAGFEQILLSRHLQVTLHSATGRTRKPRHSNR